MEDRAIKCEQPVKREFEVDYVQDVAIKEENVDNILVKEELDLSCFVKSELGGKIKLESFDDPPDNVMDDLNYVEVKDEGEISKEFEHCIQPATLACGEEHNGDLVASNQTKESGQKLYQCHKCDFASHAWPSMKRHELTHLDKKLFQCTLCSYECNRKYNLRLHLLTHSSNQTVYKCPVCEFKTNVKTNLKDHLTCHPQIELFRCSECDFVSIRKYTLKMHMLRHSMVKSFKCSVCSKAFNRKNTLVNHMFTHSEAKAFQCPICGYQCKVRSNLRVHVFSHFPKKNPRVKWTMEEKRALLYCFEFSRFEKWIVDKNDIFREQLNLANLTTEQKSTPVKTLLSLISHVSLHIPVEERNAIKEEALKNAQEKFLEEEAIGTYDNSCRNWTQEEKWVLAWSMEYAKQKHQHQPQKVVTSEWRSIFFHFFPHRKMVKKIASIKARVLCSSFFTNDVMQYMFKEIKHWLKDNISPITNPIPMPLFKKES